MQEQITLRYGIALGIMLGLFSPQSMWREQYPSDRDIKEKRRDPLPFQGDNGELPPLAWTLIWQGIYSNRFGWAVEEKLDSRFWGYVMWDAMRLERTGAEDLLVH